MPKGKGGNTVAAVWDIAAPIAEQLGLDIWDIRFVKEGADWFCVSSLTRTAELPLRIART